MLTTLRRFATGRTALAGLALSTAAQIFLATYVLPAIVSRQPGAVAGGALIMVDFKPLATADQAYAVLDMYAPSILPYVRLLYAADFVLPIGMLLFFGGLLGKSLQYLGKLDRWSACLVLPLCGLPFDYLENVIALFLLEHRAEHAHAALASVLGIATAMKWAAYSSTMTLVAVLVLASAARAVASLRRPALR